MFCRQSFPKTEISMTTCTCVYRTARYVLVSVNKDLTAPPTRVRYSVNEALGVTAAATIVSH